MINQIDMLQQKTESFVNYFQCGVCYEQFNSLDKFPRVLICGHTFCQKCISKIIHMQQTFKCPICNCKLGQLRLGLTYKNYSLLKLMELNIEHSQSISQTIVKQSFSQIVYEMDKLPKNIQSLTIKRTRDQQKNPFQFDLIRANKHSMRFYKLLMIFQKLKHFQLWVKFSAHGFEEVLAQSLMELKHLKTVKIVNAYDQYDRMRQLIVLTANESIQFDITIQKW